MPSIERRDASEAQSLGKRYDGCVDGPQGQIAISCYQFRDPYPIACENRCCGEVSRREIAEEPHFCSPAKATLDEIGDFGNDELRYE